MPRKSSAEVESVNITQRHDDSTQEFQTPAPAHRVTFAEPEFVASPQEALHIEADFKKMCTTLEQIALQVNRMEQTHNNLGTLVREEVKRALPRMLSNVNDTANTEPTQNVEVLPPPYRSPMSEDEVHDKVISISAMLEENELELEVTWYLQHSAPETASTWRGSPRVSCDDEGQPILIVKYTRGEYPLPKEGVRYVRIMVVNKVPLMPGKIDSDESIEVQEHGGKSYPILSY